VDSDGVNGILIDPHDPLDIAGAIRKAVLDDALIEKAAEINTKLIFNRLDISVVKPKVIEMYKILATVIKDNPMKIAVISLVRRGGMVHFHAEFINSLSKIVPAIAIISDAVPSSYYSPEIPSCLSGLVKAGHSAHLLILLTTCCTGCL